MFELDNTNNKELSEAEVSRLTSQIISAYAYRNVLNPDDLLKLMNKIRENLTGKGANNSAPQIVHDIEHADMPAELKQLHGDTAPAGKKRLTRERNNPAVDPKKSVFDDYLVCLEDGTHVKMLKRYLMTNYGLTPDQYRERWNLPNDYPMVTPKLSKERAETARKSELGNSRKAKADTASKETTEA